MKKTIDSAPSRQTIRGDQPLNYKEECSEHQHQKIAVYRRTSWPASQICHKRL